MICLHVKTSCIPAENLSETVMKVLAWAKQKGDLLRVEGLQSCDSFFCSSL